MQKIIILLLLVFFISCTSNTIFKEPEDLIPQDSMEMLMIDMNIASTAKYSKNKNLEKNINYMSLVYDKYNIDSVRFEKSNTYYISKIDDYKKMLERVKSRLEEMKEKFVEERTLLDSIRKDSINKRRDSIKELKSKQKIKKLDEVEEEKFTKDDVRKNF